MNNLADLGPFLRARIGRCGDQLHRAVEEASQVAIFGSRSVGFQKTTSDLDVFLVYRSDFKFKNSLIDTVVVTEAEIGSQDWRESEIANHIGAYGIWLRGNPDWSDGIRIGKQASLKKQRRIYAFLRCLPGTWERLEECFKVKYAIKLRREAQRLILIERGVPIPPTALLDSLWATHSECRERVLVKLQAACGDAFSVEKLLGYAPYRPPSPNLVDRIGSHRQLCHAAETLLG